MYTDEITEVNTLSPTLYHFTILHPCRVNNLALPPNKQYKKRFLTKITKIVKMSKLVWQLGQIIQKAHFTFGSKSGTKSLVRRYQAKFAKTVPDHLQVCHIWLIKCLKKIMFSYIFYSQNSIVSFQQWIFTYRR